MVLKMFKLIAIVVELYLIQVSTHKFPEPCSGNLERGIVATMCELSTGTEEENDGSLNVNTVVLRVPHQRDDCICYVKVAYQVSPNPVSLYLKKYNDLTSSAPINAYCGLEIDLNYTLVDGSTESKASITCLTGYDNRRVTLQRDHRLQLRSRKTHHNFTNGYCLQMYRDNKTTTPNTLKIECLSPDHPTSTESTEALVTTEIQTSVTHSTQASISTFTSTEISTYTAIYRYSKDKSTFSPIFFTSELPRSAELDIPDGNTNLYVSVGSSVGGAVIIVVLISVLIYKCRRKPREKTNQSSQQDRPNEKSEEDYDSYGLTDNVLYVPSDIATVDEGNYSNVEMDLNHLSTEENLVHVCTHSIVDKCDESVSESKQFGPQLTTKPLCGSKYQTNPVVYSVVNKLSEEQVKRVIPIDTSTEYAVVKKSGKT